MPANSDIAIVGGGLIGLSAALALQQAGRSISIIESGDLVHKASTGLNSRSIALSYASVQIFEALDLWQEIKTQAAPIKSIHVSSQGEWGVTRLRALDYELEAMGYVVESQVLGKLLLDRVRKSKGISLNTRSKFESADFSDCVNLSFHNGDKLQQLSAGLVLVADGSESKARSSLGIEIRKIDYNQSAIIANLEVSKPGAGVAYERFTKNGPLAMLPLGGKRYACVWTHDPGISSELLQLDDEQFFAALQKYFGYRLGYFEKLSTRFNFPLYRSEAQRLVKNQCLLLGNAANTLHPVAGQGLNLALRDVASLSQLFRGQPVRSLDEAAIGRLLDEYEAERIIEQRQVARIGDAMVSLFSNDLVGLNKLRAGALALVDIVPPLKTAVSMSGMGFGYAGNRLLRGRM